MSARRVAAVACAAALALSLGATPSFARSRPQPAPPPTGALVLYDTTGPYGWLGELYGIQADNLASHFGSVTAEPVTSYTAGQVDASTAIIYVGSTYDEPLPTAFLDDVLATSKPVIWASDNIWELANRAGDFAAKYGWAPGYLDAGVVTGVQYKGTTLTRDARNGAYTVLGYASLDTSRAQVLATAVRDDGTTFPYAVRSGGLTYIGDNPFPYSTPTDRLLFFEDVLFDALAPATATQHRAMVRLEDIDPTADPAKLKAITDWLYARHIPFGFGIIPYYKDPTGHYNDGTPESYRLSKSPALISAIKYMLSHGGVMVDHGYTHQYSDVANPYDAVTGDDYEFFRVTENADHTLDYVGPLPGDSQAWAAGRVKSALAEFSAAKLPAPTIFEPPHYAASAADYAGFRQYFGTRWDRGLYFGGALSGAPADYSHQVGQFFPYVVHDVYGMKVLPENCGDISPEPWYSYPATLPADIIDCAKKNLVVRDGFASFFFHPYLDISYLQQAVEGLQAAGYTFVTPATL
ncbi:MAG TPA: polysaccharide deacetylase family protein [Mycobacteriales bacterium]|nr:polysaccharide deacetylase family protein [Mycobacteriales bacterium]